MATRSCSARLSTPRWKPAGKAAVVGLRRTPCGSTPASPNISPPPRRAGEWFYRSADIRWQSEAEDRATRPSAKMRDPALHIPIDEAHMKQVIKKFPRTKWADLAAYHLIDNKLCGEWEAQAKCPEKEAEMYLKYAEEHPQEHH